jgi:DNA-binding response OmpR family regulator
MRLLLIEDDRRLSRALSLNLMDAGYAVDAAYDGEEGQAFAESAAYDTIILDVMLPRQDGIAVCRALRQRRMATPILMLTARDAVADRVLGLDSGADDYLVKPFAFQELLARLRALLRRTAPEKQSILALGDLTADPATHSVERGGQPIKLNPKEFALLEYFLRHPNQILSREQIESHLWSYAFSGTSNVVDVYVERLRRKIDDPFPVKLLETVYGLGYRVRPPEGT